MYLKYLDAAGFKSFPDRTRLTFGRGMTAVVGPNGSGKSNISDAVRWVLGEQSTKTLRGGKMEDVIFNGTATRNPHGFAEVHLVLDNTDRTVNMDCDELTITRKYYRTGESEYKINGKAVRLKDINELFMDTGLGRDGYSIIGQGRIAEIVGAKSRERREIFEEASGISRYRYRKEEAERHLAAAEDNLLRLRDNLDILEERVGPLKDQSEKAKKFLEYSDEKKNLEISVWMRSLHKIKAQLQEQNGETTRLEGEYNRLNTAYDEGEERINALYENAGETDDNIEARRHDISKAEEEKAATTAFTAVCENDIEHENSALLRLEGERAALSGEDGENEQSLNSRYEEKDKLLAKKEELLSKQDEYDKAFTAINEKRDALLEKHNEASIKIKEKDDKISLLYAEEAATATRVEEISARIEEIGQSQSKKEELLSTYKAELSEIREQIEDTEDREQSLINSQKGIALKLELRKKEQQEFLDAREKEIRRRDAAQDKANMLSDMEKSMEGFAGSVKYVLEKAHAGALNGILEPVSKIISVEGAYSLAIETAAGAALQNVVTKDETGAKQAIKMLKENHAGRVTFLPLSSVRGNVLNEAGLESSPGFVGLGYKLVKYEDKYDGIVKSILGRIVVAKTLDDAVDIAKKYSYRFRVVTLDGQVVNAGGSLTGGSSLRSAGILSRKDDIEKLLELVKSINKSLEESEEKRRHFDEEISSLTAQSLAIDSEIKTAKEDLIRGEGEKKRLLMQINDVNTAGDEAKKQSELLLAQIKEAKAKKEQTIKERESTKEEKKVLESELQGIIEEEEKIDKEAKEAGEKTGEITVALAVLSKEWEALESSIEELLLGKSKREEKAREITAQMEETRAHIESLKEDIRKSGETIEALTKKVSETNLLIESLFAQKREFEARQSKEREAQKNVVAMREEASVALAKAREQMLSLQKDYDEIIGKLYDEYAMTYTMAQEAATEIEEPQKAQRRLTELRNKIKALGAVNLSAIEEYKEVSSRYEFLCEQIGDVEKSRDELRTLIRGLMGKMRTIFTDRFTQIAGNFAVVFKELFGGGEAHLTLTDPDNVLESGIDIAVEPPGKKITNLASLSGGEQAFVAIAIYFAIMKVSPPPFCILDEIEAALDDANVNKYAEYLIRLSDSTQFIAITHRRGTMEHADRLYGVTMQEEGISKLLELSLNEAEMKA